MPCRRCRRSGSCGRLALGLLGAEHPERRGRASRKPLARAAAALAIAASALASFAASAADTDAGCELGKKLFTQAAVPACALCHTLKDAEAEGAVGPVLDELKPDAQRVAKALRDGMGLMPSYKASLNDKEIDAIAVYVSKATEASP